MTTEDQSIVIRDFRGSISESISTPMSTSGQTPTILSERQQFAGQEIATNSKFKSRNLRQGKCGMERYNTEFRNMNELKGKKSICNQLIKMSSFSMMQTTESATNGSLHPYNCGTKAENWTQMSILESSSPPFKGNVFREMKDATEFSREIFRDRVDDIKAVPSKVPETPQKKLPKPNVVKAKKPPLYKPPKMTQSHQQEIDLSAGHQEMTTVKEIFHQLKIILAYQNFELQTGKILELCDDWWNIAMSENFKARIQENSEIENNFIFQLVFASILGFLQATQQTNKFKVQFYEISKSMHISCIILSQPQASKEFQNLCSCNTKIKITILKILTQCNQIQNQAAEDSFEYKVFSHPIFYQFSSVILSKIGYEQSLNVIGGLLRNDFKMPATQKYEEETEMQNEEGALRQENDYLRIEVAEYMGSDPITSLQSPGLRSPNVGLLESGAKIPFLPPLNKPGVQYTLLLDLDETLIHYSQSTKIVLIRPGAQSFIRLLANFFEIVLFTAGNESYADWALSYFPSDVVGLFDHKLCREHMTYEDETQVKDLSLLGRDLSEVLLVDNLAENFRLQPQNGLLIKSWYSDKDDEELFKIASILMMVAESGFQDLRAHPEIIKKQHGNVSK